MSIKVPFLIKSLAKINPKTDRRWVPDGKNVWFLPCVLDLVNDNYCGYWYGIKNYSEKLHYHTVISEGYVLQGEFLLQCQGKAYSIKAHEGFVLPPNIKHTAKLIPGKKGFLYFGTVVGKAIYKNENLDVRSYYDMVSKYYKKHKQDLRKIFINQ